MAQHVSTARRIGAAVAATVAVAGLVGCGTDVGTRSSDRGSASAPALNAREHLAHLDLMRIRERAEQQAFDSHEHQGHRTVG